MPRDFNMKVFDSVVVGTTPVYTSSEYDGPLGASDFLAIQAFGSQPTGTSPTLLVQVEHSADQRTWSNKNVAAEIPATAVVSTAVLSVVGYQNSGNPTLPFVRLRVQMGGTSPGARVTLYACGRSL
jgi:hypothetical protein